MWIGGGGLVEVSSFIVISCILSHLYMHGSSHGVEPHVFYPRGYSVCTLFSTSLGDDLKRTVVMQQHHLLK